MAGRKLNEAEASKMRDELYRHIQNNPGIIRHKLLNLLGKVPADALDKEIRILKRDGHIRIDETQGHGPMSQIFPNQFH